MNTETHSTDRPQCWLAIPAAGIGSRYGGGLPKQYQPLAGDTLIGRVLEVFTGIEQIAGITVALSAEDQYWSQFRYHDRFQVNTVIGGDERCDSVLQCLRALKEGAHPDDWVLVHDVARPCISADDVSKLIESLIDDEVGGLLAVRVVDTLKREDPNGRVQQTVDRSGIWRAQTPQMFRLGMLCDALEAALADNVIVTDEAAAIEYMGYQPQLVEGPESNIKVTVPSDLTLASFYLNAQRQESERAGVES